MKAKDFQDATAKRIIELFDSGHNKVLLADEVGLGKTIVAKTVVETMEKIIKKRKKDYVVVYICSNAAIAGQNCTKLGITNGNLISISEGRLSMQHLVLARSLEMKNVRLIPMTPSTSFNMKGFVGSAPERALAYIILIKCGFCEEYKEELSVLMRTSYVETKENWDNYVKSQSDNIESLKNKERYIENLKNKIKVDLKKDNFISEIEKACNTIKESINDVRDNAKIGQILSWDKQKKIINRIRYCFSKISLSMLKPNLVIMDEFQRFKDLIEVNEDDHSDSAMLSKEFLKNNKKSSILLLSATPYKPYSTLTEIVNGEETHSQEFLRVMNFLIGDENENNEFKNVWKNYEHNLSEINSGDFTILIASKKELEEKMYNHICRTERYDSRMIDTHMPISVNDLSVENIKAYCDLQKFMYDNDLGNFPIEYVKSAPFLMSFMNYKVKNKIDKVFNEMTDIEEKNSALKKLSVSFLKKDKIDKYKQLPNTNAKFKILNDEVFQKNENNKFHPELLLWIPPANTYYKVNKNSVYYNSEGYSKTLVFSCWEIVPRVIATLVSYESERLVNQLIKNKSKEQKSYYSLTSNFDDNDNNKSKRGKTKFLINEQRDLVNFTSVWLSEKYSYNDFYGQDINIICDKIKDSIQKDIDNYFDGIEIEKGKLGARQLILLLEYMDSKILNKKATLPEKLPSEEDIETLAYMAIGSPAICLFRTLEGISLDERIRLAKECSDKSFVSLFNRPETRSIMDAIYQNDLSSNDEKHYEQVFHYCVDGNFQSMIDEFKFATGLEGDDFISTVMDSFLQTSNLPYESYEYYKKNSVSDNKRKPQLRTHFAAGYFDAKISDKAIQRVNSVRNAFNSPFRPFVLATTSIGQEGLDFHLYCRKIVHWNLPSNPIDFEQREGRINRYLCHAIRQNVAFNETEIEWKDKFEKTREKYGNGFSEMIPYWCLPDSYPYKYHIERIVPMYPFSQDNAKYDRLINVLALYRLTLGHPRQQEMISILNSKKLSEEELEELYINLSPYKKLKKTGA